MACTGFIGLEKNGEDWNSSLQSQPDRRCQSQKSGSQVSSAFGPHQQHHPFQHTHVVNEYFVSEWPRRASQDPSNQHPYNHNSCLSKHNCFNPTASTTTIALTTGGHKPGTAPQPPIAVISIIPATTSMATTSSATAFIPTTDKNAPAPPKPSPLPPPEMWARCQPVLIVIAFASRIGLICHLRIHRTVTEAPAPRAPTYARRTPLHCPHCPRTFIHRMSIFGHMPIYFSGVHRNTNTSCTSSIFPILNSINPPSTSATATISTTISTNLASQTYLAHTVITHSPHS
ncbi:hypothetical protein SprV_0200680400 [Sparganum proliferum]